MNAFHFNEWVAVLESGRRASRLVAVGRLVELDDERVPWTLLERMVDPDEDEELRAMAGQSLRRRLGALALSRMLENRTFGAPERERRLVCEALWRFGDVRSVPALLRALDDEDAEVRRGAIRGLGLLGDAAVADRLRPLRRSEDPQVRREVLLALWRIGGAQGVPAALEALSDPDREVRRDAAIVLGLARDRRAVNPLLDRLSDPREVSEVRFKAAEALAWIGDRRALLPLIRALRDRDQAVASTSAHHLGLLRDPEAIGPLALYLHARSADEYAHSGAAISLGRIGHPSAVPPLLEALADDRESVRLYAAEALGRLGGLGVVEALRARIGDRSPLVRQAAVRSLGRLGNRRATLQIVGLLSREEAGLRVAAAEALGELGDPRAGAALLQTTSEREPVELRAAATRSLGQLGLASPPIAGRLLGLLSNPHEALRYEAAWALGELGDPELVPRIRAMLDPTWADPLALEAPSWVRLFGSLALLGDWEAREQLLAFMGQDPERAYLAGLALSRVGDRRALGPCVEALRMPHAQVKVRAARALARLGELGAVPALRAQLRNSDLEVREAVSEAIRSLEHRS